MIRAMPERKRFFSIDVFPKLFHSADAQHENWCDSSCSWNVAVLSTVHSHPWSPCQVLGQSGGLPLRNWFEVLLGVSDTLSDSIQCLNFAKKRFIQYSIQYCFSQDSILNIIQFKKNLLIQFKR